MIQVDDDLLDRSASAIFGRLSNCLPAGFDSMTFDQLTEGCKELYRELALCVINVLREG